MKNRPLILVLLLISAIFVFGQDYPSFPIGQYWQFPDARSLSLGGAGSVSLNAPGAMLYNPAALTQIQNPVEGALSLSIRKLDERRSFPLYDRFDGIVAQGIYAINNNWYFRPQGAVAFRLPFAGLNNLTFAAGSFTEIDQNYNYLEEVRQNIFGDSLVAYNRIEFNGALQRYGVAAAAPVDLLPGFSLGVQAGVLQGSLDNINCLPRHRENHGGSICRSALYSEIQLDRRARCRTAGGNRIPAEAECGV
ncbi:MAG: hypothetical protein P8184_03160 [Calditrichia bacterium]